jgi:hypothetical protein
VKREEAEEAAAGEKRVHRLAPCTRSETGWIIGYHSNMTVEERLDRNEAKIQRLATVQDEMMDVLGLTLEGERRIATRTERIEETQQQIQGSLQALTANQRSLQDTVHEIWR